MIKPHIFHHAALTHCTVLLLEQPSEQHFLLLERKMKTVKLVFTTFCLFIIILEA